jgi:hypothetical protein
MVKLAFFGVVSLVVLPLASPPAAANTNGITRICEFDCSELGSVTNQFGVPPFAFELGLKAISDGLELDIVSAGSVFILGDIRSTGDIELRATEIFLQGFISTDATLILENPDFPPIAIDVPEYSGGIDLGLDDSFITLEGTLTAVTLGGGAGIAGAALVETGAESTGASWIGFSAEGDIYVDVSMVTLSSLSVDGGVAIVVSNQALTIVPEPTAAVLLGLGLLGLSAHRLRI